MKSALTLIGSFVLILAAVVCTIGAVISAFSFTVDAALLFFIWFFVALALAAIAMIWRGKGILLLTLPVLALFSWKLQEIAEGAKWVVFFISREFNKWLVWPVFFAGANESAYELTLFFAAAGVFLAFLLTAAICLRRSAFLTVFLTVPIVFITFILIHSQPDYRFLIGLLAVYLTMLISNSLYGDDFKKRGTAVLPSLAIALALLGSAYLAAPPAGYRRELRMESIDFQLRNVASRIGFAQVKHGVGWPLAASDEWRFNTNNVEISNAGTRAVWDRTILEVTASEPGTFYLRGFSMRRFDGEQWTSNSAMAPFPNEAIAMDLPYFLASEYMFLSYHQDYDPIDLKTVDMTVDKVRDATEDVVYAPYFSLHNNLGISEQSGSFIYTEESILKIVEKTRLILYTISSMPSISSSSSFSGFSSSLNGAELLARYGRQSREAYTQVDGDTAEGLRLLAAEAGIDATADREVVVDQVAQYIRSSGRYTLSPYVIPKNEDFALYFLKESKQGYCIHFATAATLMLRALDIPARFTSGFTVTVPKDSVGKPFPVTDRNAHAWVEVYYDEAGWLPLEVTPAAEDSGIPAARPHSPAAPAAPERDADAPDRVADRDQADAPPPEAETEDEAADEGPDAKGQLQTMRNAIALVFAACAAASVAALMLRRPIARRRRKRQFEQEDTNAAVICAWRYVTRLKGKDAPPKEIEELALKARFSQHTISGEERAMVVSYASKLALETYYSSKPLAKLALYLRGL